MHRFSYNFIDFNESYTCPYVLIDVYGFTSISIDCRWNSRERSPHGARAAPSSASPSASSHHVPASVSIGTGKFAVDQAVALFGVVSRADLVGKCGVVKSFDSAATRYAVCIDVSSEMVKVLEMNLRPSIFAPGGGFG